MRWRSARPGAPVDIRLFAKPNTLKNRRMGVALARDDIVEEARRDGDGGRGPGRDPLRSDANFTAVGVVRKEER